MTDFMTALSVILVQSTCPGDQRSKGVQFHSTCNLCRESHKTQVWLCFLVLSFLSASACAAPGPDALHVQKCLNSEGLKNAIERSDAMLYAPSSHEFGRNCNRTLLKCYMLELIMVIIEEEIEGPKANCIFDFNDLLPASDTVDCPPCEAFSLKDIKVFLDRLNSLLQEMNSDAMS